MKTCQLFFLFGVLFCLSLRFDAEAQQISEGGGLRFTMPDSSEFSYSLGGYAIFDYHTYDPDQPHTQMTQGSSTRSLRIDFRGTLWERWAFRTQYDFAGNETQVRHAWIQYNLSERQNIRVGQQPLPFGLESVTSTKDQLFFERAMFHRAWGIKYQKALTWNVASDRLSSSLGFFDEGESKNGDPDRTSSYNWRGTWTPVVDDDQVLHLGAVLNRTSYINAASARFRVSPGGISPGGPNPLYLADTGNILDRDALYKGAVEFLYSYQNYGIMSEYSEAHLPRNAGKSDLKFTGFYTNLVWMITGEKIPYKQNAAAIGSVKPLNRLETENGKGAWALSLRYDHLDLTDQDVDGGEEKDYTLAVIWWPNPNLKFMAQYAKVEYQSTAPTDSPSTASVRAQVAF